MDLYIVQNKAGMRKLRNIYTTHNDYCLLFGLQAGMRECKRLPYICWAFFAAFGFSTALKVYYRNYAYHLRPSDECESLHIDSTE